MARDLKKIYQAATVLEAEAALEEFAQAGTPSIRRLPSSGGPSGPTSSRCSTSTADSQGDLHDQRDRERQQRDPQVHAEPQDLPQRGVGLKLVFMAIREASKKWTMPIHHWKQALNHFAILYEDRMPELTNS